MSLLNYYISNQINPVPIKFFSKKDFKQHFLKRENLIQSHLKIPTGLLKGLKYLEFGPNDGENSCFFAMHDAEIFLVEPNLKSHRNIKRNFYKIGKIKQLKKLSSKNLENFKSKLKFDIIVAEGFLNTLVKRDNYFKKLSKFLKKKSILLINYDDKYGGIFEQIKSYLLLKICSLKSIDRFSKKSLKISKELYLSDFKKLKASRNFYAWWADQLVNPFASHTWSFKEIMDLANKNKLLIYSTSPSFDESFHFKWYKNVKLSQNDYKKKNKIFYNEWKKSFLSIVLGKKKQKLSSLKEKNFKEFNNFSNSLCNVISGKKKNNFKVKIPDTFIKLISNHESKILAKELKQLFSLIQKSNNPIKIINYYKNTKKLKIQWGSLLHYMAFKRN